MRTVKVNHKWAINYDDDNNDRPDSIERYGELRKEGWHYDNFVTALFYAHLAQREEIEVLKAQLRDAG